MVVFFFVFVFCLFVVVVVAVVIVIVAVVLLSWRSVLDPFAAAALLVRVAQVGDVGPRVVQGLEVGVDALAFQVAVPLVPLEEVVVQEPAADDGSDGLLGGRQRGRRFRRRSRQQF